MSAYSGCCGLAMPSDLGRSLVVGWIEAFVAQQAAQAPAGGTASGLQFEYRVSDRISNLLQQPVDFALRYGVPEDSAFIALPIAPDNQRVLVASPAYLARHGTPHSVLDLHQHNCLRFVVNDVVHGPLEL